MTATDRYARLAILALCCLMLAPVLILFGAPDNVLPWRFADTLIYNRAGWAFLHGVDLYDGTFYRYWPLVAAITSPISFLPPLIGGRIFAALSGGGAALGYWCVWRRLSNEGVAPSRRWLLLIAFGTPTLVLISTGQLSGLFFGVYAMGLTLLKKHPAMAGFCFGLMAAKPHLALLALPALLAAAPVATLTFALGVFLWPIGSVLVGGPAELLRYGQQLIFARDASAGLVSLSFASILPLPNTGFRVLQALSGVVLAVICGTLLLRRVRTGRVALPVEVDAMTTVTLSIMPYALDYDLPFAASSLVRICAKRKIIAALIISGWWVLPFVGTILRGGLGSGFSGVLPLAIAYFSIASTIRPLAATRTRIVGFAPGQAERP